MYLSYLGFQLTHMIMVFVCITWPRSRSVQIFYAFTRYPISIPHTIWDDFCVWVLGLLGSICYVGVYGSWRYGVWFCPVIFSHRRQQDYASCRETSYHALNFSASINSSLSTNKKIRLHKSWENGQLIFLPHFQILWCTTQLSHFFTYCEMM